MSIARDSKWKFPHPKLYLLYVNSTNTSSVYVSEHHMKLNHNQGRSWHARALVQAHIVGPLYIIFFRSICLYFSSYVKHFLLTFFDAKSLIVSTLTWSSRSFAMHIGVVAKPFNLSCDIVDLKWFFNNFNFEKLRSAEATVTGIVNTIR